MTDNHTIWSEHSYPWSPELGVNAWVPVEVQWCCCAAIWTGTIFWVVTYGVGMQDGETKGPIGQVDRWMPPLLVLPGHVIFFGFVSFSLPSMVWFNYIMNFVCLFACVLCKVSVPYLIGSFTACMFLFPVLTAVNSGLVDYDYGSYSIGVAYPTGLSNAVTFLMVQHGYITKRTRWLLQSIGWTIIMSGIPIATILAGSQIAEYKMNLLQFIRYSAFQLSIYLFIYYGICHHLEPKALAETENGEEQLSQIPGAIMWAKMEDAT